MKNTNEVNNKPEKLNEFKNLNEVDKNEVKSTSKKSKKKTNAKKQYKKQKNETNGAPEKITKAVFFHGNPSGRKLTKLKEGQKLYNKRINTYIKVLESDVSYYLDLLNNNRKSSRIKSLEKELRGDMSSAYSQNAMDHAVIEMHNYITRIKNNVYGQTLNTDENLFVANISLFNCCLLELNFEETCDAIKNLIEFVLDDIRKLEKSGEDKSTSKKNKEENIERYEKLIKELETMGKEKVEESMKKVFSLYQEVKEHKNIPEVKNAPVQLDSRLFTFDKNNNEYEISISNMNDSIKKSKNLGLFHYETKSSKQRLKDKQAKQREKLDKRRHKLKVKSSELRKIKIKDFKSRNIEDIAPRITVKLVTSKNSLRRLNQHEMSKTAKYSVLPNGTLRVTIPFVKKIQKKSDKKIFVGADVGITHLISTSDNKHFGTYSGMDKLYKETVEPELNKMAGLREAIEKHRKKLKIESVTEDEKVNIRKKIHNLNHMMQTNKSLKKALNRYHYLQDMYISNAVNEFYNHVKGTNATVVIEDLDIKEFTRSKRANLRDSNWTRGVLTKKIIDKFNWHGYEVIEVDPAYTSQVCPNCFYLDSNNRNGGSFVCLCCGYKKNADVNGAINIKERAKDKKLLEIISKFKYNRGMRHQVIKDYYAEKNAKWCKKHKVFLPQKSEENTTVDGKKAFANSVIQ